MTKEEVNKMFDGVELFFEGYYKYSFTLKGEKDGHTIIVTYGGSADDIYKLNVSVDKPVFIFDSDESYFDFVEVTNEKGEEVYSHYEPMW